MGPTKRRRAIRAAKQAPPGILDCVPECVAAKLSGADLGALADAIWEARGRAQALAIDAALDEGAIWDPRRQQLRVIGGDWREERDR